MVFISDQQHLLQRTEIPGTHPDSRVHCPWSVTGQMDLSMVKTQAYTHSTVVDRMAL